MFSHRCAVPCHARPSAPCILSMAATRQLLARFQGALLPNTDADVRPYFKSCNKSFEAKLLTNHDSAFITFKTVGDARNALKNVNGKKLKGTEILLMWNKPSRIVKLLVPSGMSDGEVEKILESKFSDFQAEIDISQVAGQKSAILRFPTEQLSVKAVTSYQEFDCNGWIWHLDFIRERILVPQKPIIATIARNDNSKSSAGEVGPRSSNQPAVVDISKALASDTPLAPSLNASESPSALQKAAIIQSESACGCAASSSSSSSALPVAVVQPSSSSSSSSDGRSPTAERLTRKSCVLSADATFPALTATVPNTILAELSGLIHTEPSAEAQQHQQQPFPPNDDAALIPTASSFSYCSSAAGHTSSSASLSSFLRDAQQPAAVETHNIKLPDIVLPPPPPPLPTTTTTTTTTTAATAPVPCASLLSSPAKSLIVSPPPPLPLDPSLQQQIDLPPTSTSASSSLPDMVSISSSHESVVYLSPSQEYIAKFDPFDEFDVEVPSSRRQLSGYDHGVEVEGLNDRALDRIPHPALPRAHSYRRSGVVLSSVCARDTSDDSSSEKQPAVARRTTSPQKFKRDGASPREELPKATILAKHRGRGRPPMVKKCKCGAEHTNKREKGCNACQQKRLAKAASRQSSTTVAEKPAPPPLPPPSLPPVATKEAEKDSASLKSLSRNKQGQFTAKDASAATIEVKTIANLPVVVQPPAAVVAEKAAAPLPPPPSPTELAAPSVASFVPAPLKCETCSTPLKPNFRRIHNICTPCKKKQSNTNACVSEAKDEASNATSESCSTEPAPVASLPVVEQPPCCRSCSTTTAARWCLMNTFCESCFRQSIKKARARSTAVHALSSSTKRSSETSFAVEEDVSGTPSAAPASEDTPPTKEKSSALAKRQKAEIVNAGDTDDSDSGEEVIAVTTLKRRKSSLSTASRSSEVKKKRVSFEGPPPLAAYEIAQANKKLPPPRPLPRRPMNYTDCLMEVLTAWFETHFQLLPVATSSSSSTAGEIRLRSQLFFDKHLNPFLCSLPFFKERPWTSRTALYRSWFLPVLIGSHQVAREKKGDAPFASRMKQILEAETSSPPPPPLQPRPPSTPARASPPPAILSGNVTDDDSDDEQQAKEKAEQTLSEKPNSTSVVNACHTDDESSDQESFPLPLPPIVESVAMPRLSATVLPQNRKAK